MAVGGQHQTLAALHPGRIPVPVGGVLVGPRAGLDGFWRRQDVFRPPEIEPRTIQSVESRYSGSGIAAQITEDKVQKSSSFSLRNFFSSSGNLPLAT